MSKNELLVLVDVLEKGRKPDPIGTMKVWGNQKYVKHSDGWVAVTGAHHGKLMGKFTEAPTHSTAADAHVESEKPKMTMEEKVKHAEELGRQAFKNGGKSAPAQDSSLMKLLEGNAVGTSTPIMDAWNKGYHSENLKAPVPEPKTEKPKAEKPKPASKKTEAKGELTEDQKTYAAKNSRLVENAVASKAHTMSLKNYMAHYEKKKFDDIMDQNLRPGPNGEVASPEKQAEVTASVKRYMERRKRTTNKNAKDDHRRYVDAAFRAGIPVSPDALAEYPGMGGSSLPPDMDAELNQRTNLVHALDLGTTSKILKKKFTEHINSCNQLVDSMGIKFKTALTFKAKGLSSAGKRVRGSYMDRTKVIELNDMTAAGKTLMHEIGHALDFSLSGDTATRGRHQEMMRTSGNTELHGLYKELDSVVTNSDYYNQTESAKHRNYLNTPTEVFARAFEVYSLGKAEQMKLPKEFTDTFMPDVFKAKDPETLKIQKELDAVNTQILKLWDRKTPAEIRQEKLTPLEDQRNKLKTELSKKETSNSEGGWGIVPEEKRKVYTTKISTIMDKILSLDKVKKAMEDLELFQELLDKLEKGGPGSGVTGHKTQHPDGPDQPNRFQAHLEKLKSGAVLEGHQTRSGKPMFLSAEAGAAHGYTTEDFRDVGNAHYELAQKLSEKMDQARKLGKTPSKEVQEIIRYHIGQFKSNFRAADQAEKRAEEVTAAEGRGKVTKSTTMMSPNDALEVDTASFAQESHNARKSPWFSILSETMRPIQYGDEPQLFRLDAGKLWLVKVDDGIYSGHFTKVTHAPDSEGVMQPMEDGSHIRIERMTIPTLVEFLQAKEWIWDQEPAKHECLIPGNCPECGTSALEQSPLESLTTKLRDVTPESIVVDPMDKRIKVLELITKLLS
jgi:hypothetical protein